MIKARKTALLNQYGGWKSSLPLRGVVRLDEDKNTLSLSLLNLEGSRYGDFYLSFGDNLFKIDDLSGQDFYLREPFELNCDIVIIFYDGKSTFPALIGNFSLQKSNVEEAIKNAKKHFKIQDDEKEERAILQAEGYNDEAISTVNYYELEEKARKGESIGINERTCIKEPDNGEKQSAKEEKEGDFSTKEPISACYNERREEKESNYYLKIKEEIESVLKEYPKEEALCKMVENSRWVKIGDGDKYYTVGVIFNKGEAEYICYGLPGSFNQRPQGVEGFSSFIPISPFNLKGDGYWVSCQNAIDGKCVK